MLIDRFPPGRQQDTEEKKDRLFWIHHMKTLKLLLGNNVIIVAVKLGKYFFEVHSAVRWVKPRQKTRQNREMKKGKTQRNTSHIVSTTEIET